LTGFVAGLSRQVVKHNVTINALLPGFHATDRLLLGLPMLGKRSGKSADEMRDAMLQQVPAGRFGTPDEFGQACAFLCSAHGGFMTGQNLLLDGGAFTGTLG
jgi:3-oxoacyl-[acyl-carrier protein] reductase